jgi:amino acid transporter
MLGPPEAPQEKKTYGLKHGALSSVETLVQSVSTISPTATPVATIPLVAALAGNGTWLAYILATGGIFLVALCISKFARYSASPGSLYSYSATILTPSLGAVVAWSLLLAYVAGGSSAIGGVYYYGNSLLHDATGRQLSDIFFGVAVVLIAGWIAWRDVKISARLMLWIEAVSLTLILVVVVPVLARHGFHLDWDQLKLKGMTGSGLRLSLVLALYSFVGFESATTLGTEARDPLKSIPRAVILSALLSGALFAVLAYAEVLGFRGTGQELGTSAAPMRVLARVGGVGYLGAFIDLGAVVSLFASVLANVTAAARVLLLMSHHGLTHGSLRVTHARNETPSRSVVVSAIAIILPVAALAWRGVNGLDVYAYMGSLGTYGFIVAYGLTCLALPGYLRNHGAFRPGAQIIPWLTFAVMLLALVGNLYPVPEGAYGRLPYIFLAYLAAGVFWFFWSSRRKRLALENAAAENNLVD